MIEFQVEITRSCYLQCSHCSSSADVSKSGYRFNFAALEAFIRPIEDEAIIYLSGGEPLLVHGLQDIIAGLSPNIRVGMYSSGIVKSGHYRGISTEEASRLKNVGLAECYFSIYDSNAEHHDRITGLPGSYNLTMKSIHAFNAAGIDTKAHIVLTRFSIDRIEQIIRAIASEGVREIRLLSLAKSGRASLNWNEIGVDHSTQAVVLQSVFHRSLDFDCRITFSGIPETTPCRPLNPNEGCVAGSKLFYICFDGSIFPCACTRNRTHYSIGNICDSTFEILRPLQTDNRGCLNQIAEDAFVRRVRDYSAP